ncbi:hypothetical protein C8J56DRAFT_919263 [Mycena floridula]|nr:hypothetical protein C8J56DRAFT_919263 [Mycena floridula]
MKYREYCCCAIPLYNAGVYAALTEQFVLGILVGILSMATPSIVGAATPSFAPWIFGIVCFVGGGVQILGFIAVAKEKTILFRRYLTLHSLLITAAFGLGAAWAAISASRHSTAQTKCISDFFDTSDSAQAAEGQVLCNIFPWVDVGIMGGLWLILAIMHIYLYVVLSSFSSGQQRDSVKYDALAAAQADNFPMNTRGNSWAPAPTVPPHDPAPYGGHIRHDSATSMSDVMTLPVHQTQDSYDYGYPQQYPPQQYSGYPPAQSTYPDPGAVKYD